MRHIGRLIARRGQLCDRQRLTGLRNIVVTGGSVRAAFNRVSGQGRVRTCPLWLLDQYQVVAMHEFGVVDIAQSVLNLTAWVTFDALSLVRIVIDQTSGDF